MALEEFVVSRQSKDDTQGAIAYHQEKNTAITNTLSLEESTGNGPGYVTMFITFYFKHSLRGQEILRRICVNDLPSAILEEGLLFLIHGSCPLSGSRETHG